MYSDFLEENQFYAAPDQDIFIRFVSPSKEETHLALNGDWSRKYVGDELGRVSDFYVSKVVESREIEVLVNTTVNITDEKRDGKQCKKKGNLLWFH